MSKEFEYRIKSDKIDFINDITNDLLDLKELHSYKDILINHEYKIISNNWIYNFGIDKILLKEMENNGFNCNYIDFLELLEVIISEWLSNRYQCYLLNINRIKPAIIGKIGNIDLRSTRRQLNQGIIELMRKKELNNAFRETFKAFDLALMQFSDKYSFIFDSNKDENGFIIPINVYLEPFYLTLIIVY